MDDDMRMSLRDDAGEKVVDIAGLIGCSLNVTRVIYIMISQTTLLHVSDRRRKWQV